MCDYYLQYVLTHFSCTIFLSYLNGLKVNVQHVNYLMDFSTAVLKVDAFPMTVMFGMCSIFLFIASILQRRLMVVAESHRSSKFGTSLVCVNNIYALNQGLQYQSVSMRTDR